MSEFCARGKALLFVSHSTSAVQQMCDRAIWLDQGTIRMEGETAEVLKAYELDFRAAEDLKIRSHDISLSSSRASLPFRSAGKAGGLRFRIVPSDEERIGSTYYIRSIRIAGIDARVVDVPLADLGDDPSRPGIDLFDSEWGRLSEHRGSDCRQLANNSARLRGGHFAIPVPSGSCNKIIAANVEIESDSNRPNKGIVLEYYDFERNAWEKANFTSSKSGESGWTMNRFQLSMVAMNLSEAPINLKASDLIRPEVAIEKAELLLNGVDSRVVAERQPFEVRVTLSHREVGDAVDVGLKISRADGTYVFWQSSGLVGQNIRRQSPGQSICTFKFHQNVLGAGEYAISIVLGNEWSYPDNYPYSRIYHRAIDILRFRIMRELEGVDFGVVNMRVPIEIEQVD
jgi:lipopolysaccharide transport system ATP-binding protein